jgi:hypothetical protein
MRRLWPALGCSATGNNDDDDDDDDDNNNNNSQMLVFNADSIITLMTFSAVGPHRGVS